MEQVEGEEDQGREAEDYLAIAIVGPTAAGKSALGIELAKRLNGEIVNYDSVQVYRGFDIGSGKVAPEERRLVPHHLIDIRQPDQVFTAGDYRREALRVLAALRQRRKLPILVGGTGLYMRALLLGLIEAPRRSEGLRARLRALAERRGREHLHRLLKRLDPAIAARIGARDTQKTIRAIEVRLLGRRPLSSLLAQGREELRGFRVVKIGLNPNRAQLFARINRRVEWMFASGLLEETRALLDQRQGQETGLKSLAALGYREARGAILGEIPLEAAIRKTQLATRRYAKRQMTWFRRESGVTWFAGFGDDPVLQREVIEWLQAETSYFA